MTSPDGAEKNPPAPKPEEVKPVSPTVACPSYVEGFSVALSPSPAAGSTVPVAEPVSEKPNAAPEPPAAPASPAPAPPASEVTVVEPVPVVPTPPASPANPFAPAPAPAPTPAPAPAPAPTPTLDAAPAATPAAEPEPSGPTAWQPFTFKGVAAFGYASADRILLVQILMALLAGLSVLWLVDRNYSPVIVDALRKMPDEAVVRNGNLEGVPTGLLSERKFLSVAVDLRDGGRGVGQSADLQLELHKRHIAICPSYRSLAGIILFRYPNNGTFQVGRTTLEPSWDAWRPICYVGIVLTVVLALLAIWIILATIYSFPARIIGYFGDRSLRLGQCWNLAAAALMPGALLMVVSIVLYGLQVVDLITLSILTVFHFVIGWVFVLLSPLNARRLTKAQEPSANPFG